MKIPKSIITLLILLTTLFTPLAYGEELKSNSNSIEYDVNTYSSQSILETTSSLDDLENLDIRITAYTQTSSSVSSLKVAVYLQKLNGSSWSTVKSWSESNTSSSSISFKTYYTVSSGGTYRVKTIHTATDNGSSETKTTYSNSLAIQ